MYCENCGTKLEANEKFCSTCGAAISSASSVAEAHQGGSTATVTIKNVTTSIGNKKKPLIIAGCIVAVVIIAVAVFTQVLGNRSAFGLNSDVWIRSATSSETDESLIIVDGNVAMWLDGSAYSSDQSLDGSVRIFKSEDTLYIITKNGVSRIADDVYNAVISNDGTGVAYTVDVPSDRSSELGTLYLYDVKKATTSRITSEAVGIVISPDGKSVAYISSVDDDTVISSISINGGSPNVIKKNYIPIAISNDGTYIYAMKMTSDSSSSGSLYVIKGENEIKLVSDYSTSNTVMLNNDNTQILYQNDDKTYISSKGSDSKKIINSSVSYILAPDNIARLRRYGIANSSITYDIDTFANKVLISSGSLYYLDKQFESSKIISSYSNAAISQNGKTLLYTKTNGKLYKISNLTKGFDSEDVVTDHNINWFLIDGSASTVYFINDDDELYYQKGNKISKIADDVEDMLLDSNGTTVYFLSDGVLYTSNNGKSKASVNSADDVQYISRAGTGVSYLQENDDLGYDLYFAKTGSKFSLVVESIY